MGQLVLLVVAAAWAAVLIPPLLRSRVENRPNSSVTDFRNQLSSLQRAVPSRTSGPMRSMSRPLAPSPLTRPAATGRPSLRSGVRTHGTPRSATHEATARVGRSAAPVRVHDGSVRVRAHGERPDARRRRPEPRPARRTSGRHDLDARDSVRRRRANILFVLVLTAASTLFLAATTKTTGMLYVFALAFLTLCGYLYLLGELRRREANAPIVADADPEPAPVRREQVARRERVERRDRSYAI